MVINLYKHRWPITMICLTFICIPFFFKFSHHDAAPRSVKKTSYGQFVKWEDVNKIFPIYAVVTVTDLDTGLQFGVQRRGGYYHADVQPLTAEDTAVMKKIYQGKWTWKRRAVTVQMDDGTKIAASMNGMPHGQGAIKDNDFNGHFCIHFADSKTHGSKKVDLAHQMMIWKSADILDRQLQTLSPPETIQVFFTAVNQGDKIICTEIIAAKDQACWKILKEIEYIRITSMGKKDNHRYSLNLRVKYIDSRSETSQSIIIELSQKGSGWKIDPNALLALQY